MTVPEVQGTLNRSSCFVRASFIPRFSLTQVSWEDKDGANLQLTGGPIFLRICLLGQLGYSDLKVPTFPVSFEQTSKYERVSKSIGV